MNFDHSRLPNRMAPVRPSGVSRYIRFYRRLCTFLEGRGKTISTFSQSDADAWILQFQNTGFSQRVRAFGFIKRLYFYRTHMTFPIPAEEPWKGRSAYEVIGLPDPSSENRTPRIPQAILEPMLRWALFYVQQGGDQALDFLCIINKNDRRKHLMRQTECNFSWLPLPNTKATWRYKASSWYTLTEPRMIAAACYFVIGLLSGMRDSEVTDLRSGCKRIKRDEAGRPYRWALVSRAFKHEPPGGSEREWVVVPEVHAAVDLLERCQNEVGDPTFPYLFQLYTPRPRTADASIVTDQTIKGNMSAWLNDFAAHVNLLAHTAAERMTDPSEANRVRSLYCIPNTDDGTPWIWSTRQLRRTIAWFIANEPFGVVAGMRQFGHRLQTTFEGYAGTSKSGFRVEVEAECTIARMRDLVDMYEDTKDGRQLGGAYGNQLQQEFARIRREVSDFPGFIIDEARRDRMLRNIAREVYPGLLNDCFFDADTALCLQRASATKMKRPIFAACDWERCPNSCFGRKHLPALRDSLSDAKVMRTRRGLTINQREALDSLIKKFTRAIEKVYSDAGETLD